MVQRTGETRIVYKPVGLNAFSIESEPDFVEHGVRLGWVGLYRSREAVQTHFL